MIGASAFSCGCISPGEKTPLRVVPAGSLLVPFAQTEAAFEASHPGVDVQVEGHGSIQAIRQVTDLHRPVDVVAVADESLIPDLMYRPMEDGTGNYTDWYTPFATNAMVIAYTNGSRYAGEVNPENWHEVLSRPDVRVGFPNPMLDAAGYRALLVTVLAEDYYGDRTIFSRVLGSGFEPPLSVDRGNGTATVVLPEVLRPAGNRIAVRDGSVYLISLLEAGGIDYAFEYRSVAEAHHLPFVALPAGIDLSAAGQAEAYARARVILGFRRFSAIGQERTGRPIVYAITVPKTARNPALAGEFVDLVLAQARAGGPGWPAPLPGAG